MPHSARTRRHSGGRLRRLLLACVCCAALLGPAARADAEIFVRWDQDRIPSRDSLGLSTIVVPAANRAAVQSALAQGYRLILEVEAKAAATFTPPAGAIAGIVIKGEPPAAALAQLKLRVKPRGLAVRVLDERGKWPHVRANWVTNNKGVLQVSSRSAQPWLENNAALIRIAQVTRPETTPIITYPWTPITVADEDEGPALENYLVAMAEAGSFGADLVLPLHARFEQNLLLGLPAQRAAWKEMRAAIEFYSWDLPTRYHRTANIGVITTGDAMRWFEVMNLLARHNLSFDLLPAEKLAAADLAAFDLLIALDQPTSQQLATLNSFVQKGGAVVLGAGLTGDAAWPAASTAAAASAGVAGATPAAAPGAAASARPPVPGDEAPVRTDQHTIATVGQGRIVRMTQPVSNPDDFAMAMRQLLTREQKPFEIWNGITVIAGHYTTPDAQTVMLTALNYAHQELPVQFRVRGRFSAVRYESPTDPAELLPFQQRGEFTEFVLPKLRVGARVFLTRATTGEQGESAAAARR